MPPGKPTDSTRRRKYTNDEMHRAILAVRGGESVAGAARQYGIPRVTLMDKLAGRTSECCKMGRKPVVGEEEELILVRWVLDCRSAGFPISTDQLIHSTQKMMSKLGKLDVFPSGAPTKRWVEGFLKRHPQLTLRECQNLTTSRANITIEQIHNWFKEVRMYFEKHNLLGILECPSRIFNCDETAFFLCPDKGKVIVGRGDKSVYRVSGNSEKDNVTVLLTCSADGSLAPSMVVFPYDRWPPKVIASIPDDWGAGKTENGWMTAQSFFEYIGNVFEPYLTEKNVERPVVLFMDGHTSHMSLEVSELCSEKQIILVALYPNATHILQPLDVAVFHPLKAAWRRAVTMWRFENGGRKLKNEEFSPLAKQVLDSGAIKPETIQNGFKTCGLLSLRPEDANLTKLLGKSAPSNKTSSATNILTLQRHLYFLESRIDPEVLATFQDEVNVATENRALFKFWKGITLEITSLRNPRRPGGTIEVPATHPEATEESLIAPEEDQAIENHTQVIFEEEPIVVTVPPDPDQTFSSMSFEVDISLNDSTLQEASENFMDFNLNPPSCSWDTPIYTPLKENSRNIISSSPPSIKLLTEVSLPETFTPIKDLNFIQEERLTTSTLEQSNQPNITERSSNPKIPSPLTEVSHPETITLSKNLNFTEQERLTTSTPEQSNQPNITERSSDPKIPSPFKQCLLWPDPKSKSVENKRKKVLTPSVVTSKVWKDYHRKIKEEKAKKELDLLERKKSREEKIKMKKEKTESIAKRKLQESFKKTSKKSRHGYDEEEDALEIESDANITNFDLEKCCKQPKLPDAFNVGMWVVVPYIQKKGGYKKFVGQIISLDDEDLEVKFLMEKKGKFVWPNIEDIDTVPKKDILTTLEDPIFLRRGYLTFSNGQKDM